MREIVGLERYNTLDARGNKVMVVHQTAYARFVVQGFIDQHNKGRPLRKVATPGFAHEAKGKQNADGIAEDEKDIGSVTTRERASRSRFRSEEGRFPGSARARSA